MSLTRERFLKRLVDSGLLSSNEASQAVDSVPESQAADGKSLAQVLVRKGVLTKYQAAAVYQGKTKGLVLGRYVIQSRIGTGGMGQVFKAVHQRMERTVALKVLPSDKIDSDDAVKRFHREVKAAAILNHPNIVTAHDADEDDGLHFLVMEFVDGKDMSTLLKEHGAFPIDLTVECMRQAAVGLAYAHKQGIIHRDIKPANLLLARESETGESPLKNPKAAIVKILDMGLARVAQAADDNTASRGLTQTGQVMGTVDFMAPEQAESSRVTDYRADIYSLGCTMYALLTADAPYEGDSLIEKLMAHRVRPAPSLMGARRDIPSELEEIFQKMVAKEPDDRFQSMDDLAAAFEKLQQGDLPDAAAMRSSGLAQGAFFQNDSSALDLTIDRPSTKTDISGKTVMPAQIQRNEDAAKQQARAVTAETLIESPSGTLVDAVATASTAREQSSPAPAEGRNSMVIVLVLLLLGVTALAGGGWYYAFVANPSQTIADNDQQSQDNSDEDHPENTGETGSQTENGTDPENTTDEGNSPDGDSTGSNGEQIASAGNPDNVGAVTNPPGNGETTNGTAEVTPSHNWRNDEPSPPIPPDLPIEPPMIVEVLPPDPRDDPVRPPIPPDPLAKGLAGHWRFTDGGGEVASDSSPAGNDGRTWLVVREDWEPLELENGREIPALSLNGLASVTIADHDSLDATDALTIAMWMKSGGNKRKEMILLDKGPTTGYSLILDPSGYPRFRMGLNNKGRVSAESLTAPRKLNDGKPHHVAVVFDGQRMQFFLDGKASFNLSMLGKVMRNTGPLQIGGGPRGRNGFYGHIADVRVYRRALAPEEIAELAAP